MVTTLGVFHAMHAAYPRAEIAWAVQPEFADLLEGLPGLSRVFLFGRREGWRAWTRLRAELAGFRPDLVVDAQANWKSSAVTFLARAPRRAGLARSEWREKLGSIVLNDPAPPTPAGRLHAQERMQSLVLHVAPGAELPLRSDPALSPPEIARGEELLELHQPPHEAPSREGACFVLHLSSHGDIRSWPLERWLELARALVDQGRRVLFVSGPAEADLGREIARRLPEQHALRHWIGQQGLRDLAGFFTAAGRRGWRLIACDSGPMHLATVCGLSTVALEGPQDEARTGPWPRSGPHRVVRARSSPSCAPCLARRCRHPEGPICMSALRAEEVLAALD